MTILGLRNIWAANIVRQNFYWFNNYVGRINFLGPKTIKLVNTPTGASTNPKNFDLNKNLNMNLT